MLCTLRWALIVAFVHWADGTRLTAADDAAKDDAPPPVAQAQDRPTDSPEKASDAEKPGEPQRPSPPAPAGTSSTRRGPPGPPAGPPSRSDSSWHDRHRHGPPHGFGSDFRERDPELHKLYERDVELDRRTHAVAERARMAQGDEKDAAMKELRELVADHFRVRQERRELELKRLEEQLDRLRSSVKRRAEQQSEIIDERIKELTAPPKPKEF